MIELTKKLHPGPCDTIEVVLVHCDPLNKSFIFDLKIGYCSAQIAVTNGNSSGIRANPAPREIKDLIQNFPVETPTGYDQFVNGGLGKIDSLLLSLGVIHSSLTGKVRRSSAVK